jgi:hypothetical protein
MNAVDVEPFGGMRPGATVTFIEDGSLLGSISMESVRSCGGASKSAIGLLIEKHVQDH